MTFFWAVGGWHRGDSIRVGRGFRFIKKCLCDYGRILGEVTWIGEEIDPWWSDYKQTLAATIDCAWDEGLRVQLTAIGGRNTVRPVDAAKEMAEVIEPRKHKVIMLESVNEHNAGVEVAIAIAKVFKPLGIPFGVGLGNQRPLSIISEATKAVGANVSYLHTERTPGDNGARQVRQAADFRALTGLKVENEPPGIASSVATFEDPFKMATKRFTDIVFGGAAAFCVHPGAGVFGRYMTGTYGVRHANLDEVPGLLEMAHRCKDAEKHLPAGIENWTSFNTGQPIKGVTGRMNKLYGARSGKQFVEVAFGCEDPENVFRAEGGACDIKVVNPATGDVLVERSLNHNETFQVSGLWAYGIVGTLR